MYTVREHLQFNNLEQEVESRWQLVEAAWENNIAKNLMLIEYDKKNENFIGDNSLKRTTVTSARPALNGYQKGRCFYCFSEITIYKDDDSLADVDHFFPHVLKLCDNNKPVDGVSNLVLSCKQCNRGEGGKFEKIPSIELLDRLYTRNEYLISSHHPLRETLIAQTGITSTNRQNYMQDIYNCASAYVGAGKTKWQPTPQGDSIF
jgi:5-methylcytosine-specific restriction endonuclease McrA